MVGSFHNTVVRRLEQQARRLRWSLVLEVFAAGSLLLLGVLATQLLLDWSLRLPWDMRAVLLGGIVALAGTWLYRRLVRPLRLRFGAVEMAAAVERRYPQLDALLVSAVRFNAGDVGAAASNSPQLTRAVIDAARASSADLDFDSVVASGPIHRSVRRLVGVLAVWVAMFLIAPQTMGVWMERNLLLRSVDWPKRTRILVDAPEDRIIHSAVGDDLDIRCAVADGYDVPREVEIVFETDDGKDGRETMTGVGARGFRTTFPRLRDGFRFYVTGGDDTTDEYTVELAERPRIDELDLRVTPPSYTGLAQIDLPGEQRSVEIYPGSTLTIRARPNKPLARAALLGGDQLVAECTTGAAWIETTVAPTESTTYQFALRDLNGLDNRRPIRLSVRLLTDDAPTVRLQARNVGNLITDRAVLPLEIEIQDALGIAAAALQVNVDGQSPAASALADLTPGARSYTSRLNWSIGDAGVDVGAHLSLFVEARDFDDVSGPNVGTSTTVALRVVTVDELLAELNRREQDYRRQFERTIEAQERVRRDLLSVIGRLRDDAMPPDLDLLLAPLERRQRQIGTQVGIIRQQFEQILSELTVNRLDAPEVRSRLADGIIAPLIALGRAELVDCADQLRRLGREPTLELAAEVDPLQAQVLARMQAVLDSMLKWEGFQETLTLLREILRLQAELNTETVSEMETQGSDLFDK